MKTRLITLAVGFALGMSVGVFHASANLEVSVGVSISAQADFYEPLNPCGTWVQVGSYGRCWRPSGITVEWRPYCNGYWEWTDCGWYWVSDEPWAWACYHYGSWVYDSEYGWIWVPGIEWAPAWVYWRINVDYVGWAPCPPPRFFFSRHVEPSAFVFVDSRHFNERVSPKTVIVNNLTIIKNTTEITRPGRANRNFNGQSRQVVINQGPGVELIEKATGKKFAAVSVREADRKTSALVPEKFRQRSAEPGRKPAGIKDPASPAPERKPAPEMNPEKTKAMPAEEAAPPASKSKPGKAKRAPQAAPPAQSPAPSEHPTPDGNGHGNANDKDQDDGGGGHGKH